MRTKETAETSPAVFLIMLIDEISQPMDGSQTLPGKGCQQMCRQPRVLEKEGSDGQLSQSALRHDAALIVGLIHIGRWPLSWINTIARGHP